ncbi:MULTISPECIES: DUF3053 domain-containing protein [Tatumella]|uniref:DUF3053 domain-containing protein n=1 Tax=Tatumella punctata TaxID=399969 RepID=A0ABW1VKJ5_9GAMM|nr:MULTISPECIES: DUF3053 domain-containing protein [unclassified Tatumella]MBS0856169.1 DUF3053 domain-containing protein [Tatumella sp. JGM16]MBS0877523.1 DUF3053 domain-containing protein [Tatumella sp. JGM82]MBS0891124.1 DUF3053 domain-containing protein [Tatumella sp. JGM94]MBS0894004.1 DUF3053 domain-containing protein [Tatumella sp. JGM130]MBS0902055.1 DUF3053 domain-containing protein [Tatumella sp. JGM100]
MASGIFRLTKQSGLLLATFLMISQLTGCGDKQAEQSQAFSDFLQNTVMRSGSQLPTLSESQKKNFGNFAGDYAILYGFSQQLNKVVNDGIRPVTDELSAIKIPADYQSQRDALRQAAGALNVVTQQVQTARNLADSSKSSLKLPPELQKTYEAAYSKVVTRPADSILPLLPQLQALSHSVIATGDFLQAQSNSVSFANNNVQFASKDQVNQYNTLVGEIASEAPVLGQLKAAISNVQ